jgi:hypothetical protein
MHRWQDIVLAIGSLIFALALLPSVFSQHKPALWTSGLTGVVLVIFAVTYASLTLWYATVTTSLAAILWLVLAVQKMLQPDD